MSTLSELKSSSMKNAAPKAGALSQLLQQVQAKESALSRLDEKLSKRLNGFKRKDAIKSIGELEDLRMSPPA